jgi:hypothetical protein
LYTGTTTLTFTMHRLFHILIERCLIAPRASGGRVSR